MTTLKALVALHQREREAGIEHSRNELIVLSTLRKLYAEARVSEVSYARSLPIGEVLRPSVFELVDHNFRENSHSNVLGICFVPAEGETRRTYGELFSSTWPREKQMRGLAASMKSSGNTLFTTKGRTAESIF